MVNIFVCSVLCVLFLLFCTMSPPVLKETCCIADQQQIQYVTSKVSLVEAMHDGLLKALNSLTKDVHNGKCLLNV